MKQTDIKKLIKREYLRGWIDGIHRDKCYTIAILDKQYRKYIKANPEVIKSLANLS